LGPIGILKGWTDSSFPLKKALLRMGTTAIGNRIYVVGGTTPVNSAQEPVADVWSAAVSTTDGSFIEDWQAEPSLPAVKHSDRTGFDGTIAAVNSAAVTSVATGNGGGYIYVLGGSVSTGAADFFRYSLPIRPVLPHRRN